MFNTEKSTAAVWMLAGVQCVCVCVFMTSPTCQPMHHFKANSTFSAEVCYVNQLQHSWGIPTGSYCAAVSLLTVCLEPVMFVWALFQCGAHFHTFFTEVPQSFPVSDFSVWSQVLLFLPVLLSQCFLILQWILEKKHCCSFPFSPHKEY